MTSEIAPISAAAEAPRRGAPIVHTEASVRSRILYVLARIFAKQAYRIWPLGDRGISALALIDTAAGQIPTLAAVEHSRGKLGTVPVERYSSASVAENQLAGARVLYLHGGGFTFCGVGTHRRVTSRMAQALSVPVYSVLYRQLPHGGVGSATHDACAAYRALIETCPDPHKVILAGDSSGGFLAAKICELAAADGLPMPAAYIGYSPQLDLDADERDYDLIRHDALMPVSAYRRAKRQWVRGPVEPRGARSMLQVDPRVFPPTFLAVAGREMFEADVLEFADMLAAGGRTVETHVWHRQVHAFPVLDGLLPESREVMRLTVDFLCRSMAEREPATE